MAEWNEHVLSVRARLDKASKQEMIDSVRDVFTEGAHIDFKSKENLRGLHELADIMNKIFSAAGNTKFDFSKMINLPGPELFDGLKEAAKEFDTVWSNVVQKFNSNSLKDFFMQDLSALDSALQRVSKSAKRVEGLEKAFKDVRVSDPEKILERLKSTQSHYTAADNINWEDQYADLLKYIKLYEKYVTNADADVSTEIMEQISQIGPYTYKQLKEVEAQISTSLNNIFRHSRGESLIGLTDGGRINFEVTPKVMKTLEVGDVLGGKQSIEVPVVFKAKLDLMRDLSEAGDFDQLEKLQDEIASMFPEDVQAVVLKRLEKFAEFEKVTARSYQAIWKDFIGYGMPTDSGTGGSGTGFGPGDGSGTGDASSAELEAAKVKIGQLESEVESLKTEIEKIKKKAVKEPQPKKKMVAHEEVLALQAQISEKENEIDALKAELNEPKGAGGSVVGDNSLKQLEKDAEAASKAFEKATNRLHEIYEEERRLNEQIANAGLIDYDEKIQAAGEARENALNALNQKLSKKADHKDNVAEMQSIVQNMIDKGAMSGISKPTDLYFVEQYMNAVADYSKHTNAELNHLLEKAVSTIDRKTKETIVDYKEAQRRQEEDDPNGLIAQRRRLAEEHAAAAKAYNDAADAKSEAYKKLDTAKQHGGTGVSGEGRTSEDIKNARKVAEYEEQARKEAEAREKADKRRKELTEQMELYSDDENTYNLEESEGQKAALQEILNTLKQENLLTDELQARYDTINSKIDERISLLKSVKQAYDTLETADNIDYNMYDVDEAQQALDKRKEIINAIPQNVIDHEDDIAGWVEEIVQGNLELEKRIDLLQQAKQGLIDIDAVDDILAESGDLDSKLGRLQDVASSWGADIKDADVDEDSTALESLEEFEATYDRIILKLANGHKVEILPNAKGLRALNKYDNGMDSDAYGESEIADVEFVRKEIQQIPPVVQEAETSLEALYERGSDAAKKAIQDMAIADNKFQEFNKMVDTNPEPRNQFIPLSEEEKAKFLNVAKEYQNTIKQINDLEIVAETEDDKQRLIDLKTEAIKLHKVLRQAYAVDGNIYSYIQDYGLSYEEAEKFYSSIQDQNPQKFIEQIRQEYQTSYDDSFDRMEQLNPEFRQQMFKDMSELEALMDRLAATQENLNHVESQNPPAQDDSGVHNTNAEAVEKEIAAIEKRNAILLQAVDLYYAAKYPEMHPGELESALQNNPNIISDLTTIKDDLQGKLQPVQEMANKISQMSSIKDIPFDQLRREAISVGQQLSDMYDQGITDTEEYIALQYKLIKIIDKIGALYGGVKGSGAQDISELRRWVRDSIESEFGTDPMDTNVVDALWGQGKFSIMETNSQTFNMRDMAAKLLNYDGLDGISLKSDLKDLSEINFVIEELSKIPQTANAAKTSIDGLNDSLQKKAQIENADNDGAEIAEENAKTEVIKQQNGALQENINLKTQANRQGVVTGSTGTDTGTGTGRADGATTEEVENLKHVQEAVSKITAEVKEKTQEFLNEKSAVKKVAESEVHALGEVEKKVAAIRVALNNVNTVLNNIKKGKDIGAGLSNININVNHKTKEKKDEPVSINVDQLKSTLESVVYNVKIAHSDTDKDANKVAINAADLESVLRKVFSNKPGEKDKTQPKKQLPKIDSKAVKTETDTLIEQYRRILSTIEEWKILYEQLKTITFGSTTDFRKQMLPMLQNMSPELVKMVGGSFAENFANGFKGIKTKDIFAQLQGIVNCDLLGSVTDQVNILNSVDFDNFNLDELKISSINAVYFLEEAFELLKKIDALKNGVIGGLDVDITGEKKDGPRKESYALENTLQNVAKILTKIQENTASLKGVKLQQAVDANTDASRQVAAAVEGEGKSEKTGPKLNKVAEKYSSEDSKVPFRRVETESSKTPKSYRTTKTHKKPIVDEEGNWTGDYDVDLVEVIDDYDKIRKESDKTKKMVERAQKKVNEFVAKFDSKTGGNAKFVDGFSDIQNFTVNENNIDEAYNKMIMLQQKYAELEKNFRKGQSSLNPFVNAINKSQNIGNIFGDVETKFDGLVVKSDELTTNFNELKRLSEQIQAFTKKMDADPDSITPADFTEFSKQMGEFTSLKTQVDSMIRSETGKNKEIRTHNAQVEAEVVKELIRLYEQLGRAQATENKDETSRLRSAISTERGKLSSVDYATDMKFKDAKSKGFEAEMAQVDKIREEKIKKLNKLYQEYGVLAERASAASGNFGEQLQNEVLDKEAEIQNLRDSMDLITPEMFEGFDEAFDRGRQIESTKQYEALAKQSDADEATRLRNIASLEKEIGRLRADADAATNVGVQNALEEEIQLREKLIELQKQGLEMEAQDEAYYRQNAANRTKQAKAEATQDIKDRKETFKEREKEEKKQATAAKKLAQREAMLGKTGSAVGRAENVWTNAASLDGDLPDGFTAEIDEYYQKLDTLRKKHQELKNSDMISEEQKKELIAQTMEINKMTEEIGELVSEYQRLSGDNTTVIGSNTLDADAGLNAYSQQLKQAVMTATNGKAQIQKFDAATQTLTYTVKTGKNEFTEYTAAVRHLDGQLVSVQGTTKRTETFFEATARKMKELTSYFSGMAIFSRIGQELRRGIQYVREIDLALTELKKVTDETEETYDKFLDTAAKTADKVGSTIQKVVSSTADWARLNI